LKGGPKWKNCKKKENLVKSPCVGDAQTGHGQKEAGKIHGRKQERGGYVGGRCQELAGEEE